MAFKDFVRQVISGSRVEAVREYEVSFSELLSSLSIRGELELVSFYRDKEILVLRVRS